MNMKERTFKMAACKRSKEYQEIAKHAGGKIGKKRGEDNSAIKGKDDFLERRDTFGKNEEANERKKLPDRSKKTKNDNCLVSLLDSDFAPSIVERGRKGDDNLASQERKYRRDK